MANINFLDSYLEPSSAALAAVSPLYLGDSQGHYALASPPWRETFLHCISPTVSFMDLALVLCSLQALISLASTSKRGHRWQLGLFYMGKEEESLFLAPFCRQ